MDEEEAGIPPQKDEDPVDTIPASKTPPKVNHDESNSENVAAELHNGSGHVSSEEAENNKESAGTPEEGEEEQDHSVNSGSEKWKLHLDVSDSASTTTDNEGSEIEDKCDESGDNILLQKTDDTPKNVQSEESEDFRGFEIPASEGLEELNELIDEAQKDLLHTASDSDTEVQETTGVVSSSSRVAVDRKNFEDVRIGDQKVRFTFRVIGTCDGAEDDEDDDDSLKVVTAENSDVSRDVDDSMDETSRDGKLSTVKQEFQEKVEEEDASSMEVTSQMDSQFDGRKFANEVSSEVTSSADVASSTKTDSGPAMEDLTVSEVTSSATSSPLSSRSSLKVGLGSRRSRGDSPALAGGNRGKKITVDLSNPAFRKPLELGWKRELVYRNTSEASNKKMADIYYYTPLGKKVRSNREVLEHLTGMDLTLDNFTFFKEPLGIDDPSKEIIRDAKKISMKDPALTPVKKTPKAKTTPVVKMQEIVTPPPPATTEALAVEDSKIEEKPEEPQVPQEPSTPKSIPAPVSTTPAEPKVTTKVKGSNAKAKKSPYNRNAAKASKESAKSGETEMGMLPPWWCPKKSGDGTGTLSLTTNKSDSATWSENTAKKSTMEPCSINCTGMMGLIPSLQCRLCLCLYHPECVGLRPVTETVHSYVCKNCQQEVKEGKPMSGSSNTPKKVASTTVPPPLTPISSLGAGNKPPGKDSTTNSQPVPTPSSPPKLQRLPRLSDVNSNAKFITVPRLVKLGAAQESLLKKAGASAKKSSIVGAVTTWLPPSSTIQLNSGATPKTTSGPTSTVSAPGPVTSTVPVSDPLAPSPSPASVQAIARMAGKKYIVVPKHNVLSVSPSMAASATTPTSKSSVQVADSTPLVEKAPVSVPSSVVVSGSIGNTTAGAPGFAGQQQFLITTSTGRAGGDNNLTLIKTSTTPILPTASAFLLSGGPQNPPGVLLVPLIGSTIPTPPVQNGTGSKITQPQHQYLILNGAPNNLPPTNFVLGSTHEPKPSVTAPSAQNRDSQTPAKRLKASATQDMQHFMQNFMTNVSAGYSSMLHVFQYLKVQELLRAARVCRMWRDLASHPSLWQTVRMKNSQVVDWKGFAESLQRRGTQHLDLRKMLVPGDDTEHMWDEFRRNIGQVTSLSTLDLCRCPSRVVESIATTCPQLKVINALSIKCDLINLSVLGSLKNLQELRLKSLCGVVLTSSLVPLKHLTGLKHLSLTTFKDLGKKDPVVLGSLKNLESLELGECCDMPEKFGPEALSQLKKLERLRLEKGQGKSCPTFSILHGVCMLPKLTHLELINFDVKPGFDEALAQCTNIRRLLIIPTYVTQSATTNHMVLNGVNQLRNTLTHFVWGITHELLRVTELFVDQCEGQKDKDKSTSATSSKGNKKFQGGDSIPILKPAEGSLLFVSPKEDIGEDPLGESKPIDATSGAEEPKDEGDEKAKAPQVEILPLPKLQKFLTTSLPKTKVQILKIPFHATWRQTISETTS